MKKKTIHQEIKAGVRQIEREVAPTIKYLIFMLGIPKKGGLRETLKTELCILYIHGSEAGGRKMLKTIQEERRREKRGK